MRRLGAEWKIDLAGPYRRGLTARRQLTNGDRAASTFEEDGNLLAPGGP